MKMEKERSIRVTGKGQLKIHPDQTCITMTLEGKFTEYAETLQKSAEETEELKSVLEQFGFARTDLKTLSFSVDPQYESYEEKGTYRQRFAGYAFHHVLRVEFDSDRERLGKILYALAHSEVNPEIRLSYQVKDREAAKNELLGRAVKDAREKAKVLSEAAGITLGEIRSIDYSWGEIDFEVTPMDRALSVGAAPMMKMQSYDLDVEPDDVEVDDTVTVVWEIR